MAADPWILGIGGSHNGGASLLKGNEMVVAVQEERLSGVKRDWTWLAEDSLSITYCLEAAGIEAGQLDAIAVSALPSLDHPRHDVRSNPLLAGLPAELPVIGVGHHLCHAAGTYALSGFADAAILVIDGSGSTISDVAGDERAAVIGPYGSEAISMYRADGERIIPLAKHMTGAGGWLGVRDGGMRDFGSLGGMYSAVADQIFGDVHAAGKVMGLAPCGEPTIAVEEFLTVDAGTLVFSDAVSRRFRHDARWPDRSQEYADLAASVQAALEAGLATIMENLRGRVERLDRLGYAGGVALNVVANQQVISPCVSDLFILPGAEDSGVAVGAAYAALWRLTGSAHHPRRRLRRDAPGRSYDDEQIGLAIARLPGIVGRRPDDALGETTVRLAEGQVVGWFQEGSELGPRSLGQRTLLCDPRAPDAKARVNARVKYREAFRPFAPVLPEEAVPHWFRVAAPLSSPFMLAAADFLPERARQVPAVVHVDGTGRLQTVRSEDHPLLGRLLDRWTSLTGVPILLNTSFNLAGEPIVETPDDALRCLLSSGIDCCLLGSWIVEREADISLLDMFPQSLGRRLQPANGSPAAYGVLTPWGSTSIEVGEREAAIVSAATGDVSARDLLAVHAQDLDDRNGVQALHRLARLRLLSFFSHDEQAREPRTLVHPATGT